MDLPIFSWNGCQVGQQALFTLSWPDSVEEASGWIDSSASGSKLDCQHYPPIWNWRTARSVGNFFKVVSNLSVSFQFSFRHPKMEICGRSFKLPPPTSTSAGLFSPANLCLLCTSENLLHLQKEKKKSPGHQWKRYNPSLSILCCAESSLTTCKGFDRTIRRKLSSWRFPIQGWFPNYWTNSWELPYTHGRSASQRDEEEQ